MPEGHTVHRLARRHHRHLAGAIVRSSSPQGRFDAKRAHRCKLLGVEAYGKHLLYAFRAGWVHVHLGLYGRYFHHRSDAQLPTPRDTVRWRLVAGGHAVDLVGPTRCEWLDPAERDALLARLGPDPLRDDADPDRAIQRLADSRAAVGRMLMDQSVLSGVGNIYRCELLYRAKLDPRAPGRDIDPAALAGLWDDARTLLRRGVRQGAIITVEPEVTPDQPPASAVASRRRPPRGERHYVYRQRNCLGCGGPVARWTEAGRQIYACIDEQLTAPPPPGSLDPR